MSAIMVMWPCGLFALSQPYRAVLDSRIGVVQHMGRREVTQPHDPSKSLDPSQSEARAENGTLPTLNVEQTQDSLLSPFAGMQHQSPVGSIGRYQLLQLLGEGGMGQVWLAEQSTPVKRQVALKLIRNGIYDAAVARRFASEQQSLAIMEHPAIAKVFDAGSTPAGNPYFVMEYVPGLPITQYCDQKKLKIRERLELFTRVCEGVQHAHQKAIIHRDLKPSNILVTEIDGKPEPRIIDFGIAKAVQPDSDQTLLTRGGAPMGTPGYMSPEQADPAIADVDTRTDVYSLGVVLYELLVGAHPFDSGKWRKQPFDEVLRQLREEDPLNPSTRLSREKETSNVTAEMRGTEPGQLMTILRGDLDWITMKALEKDRARRYGTPSELAADLGRYLRHEPVVARPATTGYRLRKYVRRHRVGVAAAAGLALLLVAFAVMQAVQLRRITRERDRANRITDFMTHMFKVSQPSEARGNTITVREILDKASTDIDTGLAKDPELQANMMDVMGNVYTSLGLYQRGDSLLSRAVETRRHVLGEEPRHAEVDGRPGLGSSAGRSLSRSRKIGARDAGPAAERARPRAPRYSQIRQRPELDALPTGQIRRVGKIAGGNARPAEAGPGSGECGRLCSP